MTSVNKDEIKSSEVTNDLGSVCASGEKNGAANTPVSEEKTIIDQLSLKLLQQTELTNSLQQRIAELNRASGQQKQLLVQARKEKHEADLEVSRLSTEVENITQELFEQANSQVKEANLDAYNIKKLNDRLSNTIKEKNTTIEILQTELSNLKSIIASIDKSNASLTNDTRGVLESNISLNQQQESLQQPAQNLETDISLPEPATFKSQRLEPFNGKQIYTPLFNQLRFDLPAFKIFSSSLLSFQLDSASGSEFDIKTTKFFLKLIDELDEDLRLDKAPALQTLKLRWNRKNLLYEILEKPVTIEPLSAATEAWKRQTLQKYVPPSTPSTPSTPVPNSDSNPEMPSLSRFSTSTTSATPYDPTLFKFASNNDNPSKPQGVAPLAVTSACGLCGEKRRDMNFSRLYHLRINSSANEEKGHKSDYPLCINCANRFRVTVELLKYVKTLDASKSSNEELDDYIRSSWATYVQLKAHLWYTVNIGIWSEKESYGLVYGWQNDWLVNQINRTKTVPSAATATPVSASVSGNSTTDSTPLSSSDALSLKEEQDAGGAKSGTTNNSKGWNGWSDILAKPASENNVDVGFGFGIKVAPNTSKIDTQSRRNSLSNVTLSSIDQTKINDDVSAASVVITNEFQDASEDVAKLGGNSDTITDEKTPEEEGEANAEGLTNSCDK